MLLCIENAVKANMNKNEENARKVFKIQGLEAKLTCQKGGRTFFYTRHIVIYIFFKTTNSKNGLT